jgi:glycosyltransferase involved in cell wall biosynthesis
MAVTVVIPALNEEASVGLVVRGIPPDAVQEVIVVDNGSTDRTAEVAAEAGARVVYEPRRGYGSACLAGGTAAQGDIVVFMDADGSFEPAEIPRLVAPCRDGRAELVLGSRELGEIAPQAMPFHQRFGNWLAVQLLRRLYGLQVTDLGPFRALPRERLLALHMSELTYGWPIEMMIKAAQLGYRLVEVPVSYRPRYAGQSKVSGTVKGSMLAGYRVLRTVLIHLGSRKRGAAHG